MAVNAISGSATGLVSYPMAGTNLLACLYKSEHVSQIMSKHMPTRCIQQSTAALLYLSQAQTQNNIPNLVLGKNTWLLS